MITLETRLVRSDTLVAAPMDGDVALMDMESDKYFILPRVAADIWGQLASPATPAELCDALMRRYAVSAERCRADVLPFLQEAYDKGLLRRAD